MTAVHFAIQFKGGVGKSWVATMITQYLKERGTPYRAVDVEAKNASSTLSGFPALGAERLKVIVDHAVEACLFDPLQNSIMENPETFVVDIGTSIVVPYVAYMIDDEGFDNLRKAGREVFFHIPVVADPADLLECLVGYRQICDDFPMAKVVVWLCQKDGEIVIDGKHFEQTTAYLETKKRVAAIIRTPKLFGLRSTTHGRDMKEMWGRQETFEEALALDRQPLLPMTVRQRLAKMRRELWEQMDAAKVF